MNLDGSWAATSPSLARSTSVKTSFWQRSESRFRKYFSVPGTLGEHTTTCMYMHGFTLVSSKNWGYVGARASCARRLGASSWAALRSRRVPGLEIIRFEDHRVFYIGFASFSVPFLTPFGNSQIEFLGTFFGPFAQRRF